jgi:hypothetical protein
LQKNGQPTENQSGLTFEAMQKAAIKDPEMRKRLNYILLRRREELFDLANDPYSFNNLSDEPDYAGRKSEMKLIMAKAMVQTDDPLLKSLLNGGSYPQSWNER